ncbi:MFS transporter [Nonomuraea sp. NPDC000554]|uniref:MFS transporter n=1 Tax=Nonomuraea sp. NPDC000554 TaxID=3154259 RepID=UPI00331A5D58
MPVTASHRWWALPVVLVAVFMTTLDFFIVHVAVPSIRADLRAGGAAVQLTIAGYGLAYAAGLIVSGRLGDLYGPRRVFASGLALFTVASAACGVAPSVEALVPARVAQGVAAALLAPQVLTLLGVLYQGEDRARAFRWYGTAVGLAGTSGQVLGGLLVSAAPVELGWRACFLINVPIGAVALCLTTRLLPAPGGDTTHPTYGRDRGRPSPSTHGRNAGRLDPAARGRGVGRFGWAERGRGLDVVGAVLVAAGLVAVVLPLAQGREAGWPWWAWASLAASTPILAGFARRQRRLAASGREPLLDLRLLREPRFAAGLVAVALLFGCSAGLSFVLALYLQDGLGLAPLAAGSLCTALNAGFFVASLRAGRRPPVVGAVTLVIGLALLYLAFTASPYWLVVGLLVAGAGMGLVMSPLVSGALAGVRPELAGAAAGVLGTVQEAGGVLGATVTGAVFFAALDGGWQTAAQAGTAVTLACALGVAALTRAGSPRRALNRTATTRAHRQTPNGTATTRARRQTPNGTAMARVGSLGRGLGVSATARARRLALDVAATTRFGLWWVLGVVGMIRGGSPGRARSLGDGPVRASSPRRRRAARTDRLGGGLRLGGRECGQAGARSGRREGQWADAAVVHPRVGTCR